MEGDPTLCKQQSANGQNRNCRYYVDIVVGGRSDGRAGNTAPFFASRVKLQPPRCIDAVQLCATAKLRVQPNPPAGDRRKRPKLENPCIGEAEIQRPGISLYLGVYGYAMPTTWLDPLFALGFDEHGYIETVV